MAISLRPRIILTLAPLLVLLVLLSVAAVILLHRLGGLTDRILHDDYDSVIYMVQLNEALERIDSSFQFALAGEEAKAKQQYLDNWILYRENLTREQNNITVPGEGEQVARLTALSDSYARKGDSFFARPERDSAHRSDYFESPGGLLDTFLQIKKVSGDIRQMNQDAMEEFSREAHRAARDSVFLFAIILAASILIGFGLAWQTIRAILRPIHEMTESAVAIGQGNLHQVVPVTTRDELGQLANAFNTMARQLRGYRESSYSRLLRAQRTSQATIDSFPDPVLVVDPERHVEMANPAARRQFGVAPSDPDQPAGPSWEPPTTLRAPLELALKEQQSYLPEGFDRAIKTQDGTGERIMLPHILPISDPYGNTLGAAVIFHDITRFRLLDQVKSDLVATVSHELKTPLTSLRLAIHLLLEESIGPLNPKQTELLVDARADAELLLARVNRLLDMARLEQGGEKPQLVPEAPAALLRSAAAGFLPRAKDKAIALMIDVSDELPAVAADPNRLGHALNNLLDNALTYTERGGRISLSATADQANVTLVIADTGRGMAPEHVPHIFDKFYRIPGQSKEGGTGLGLAIVREIVTAHHGDITCESELGKGTVFRVRLPIWREPGGP